MCMHRGGRNHAGKNPCQSKCPTSVHNHYHYKTLSLTSSHHHLIIIIIITMITYVMKTDVTFDLYHLHHKHCIIIIIFSIISYSPSPSQGWTLHNIIILFIKNKHHHQNYLQCTIVILIIILIIIISIPGHEYSQKNYIHIW